MYVRWKTLLFLGIVLWIVLCLTDILYDKYGSKKYNLDSRTGDEFRWMHDVPKDDLLFSSSRAKESLLDLQESDYREEGSFGFGLSLVFWNCIAFLSSIALCSALRSGALMLLKRYFERRYLVRSTSSPEILTLAVRASPSRIPIRKSFSYEERSSAFLGGGSQTDVEPTKERNEGQQSCMDLSPSRSFDNDLRIKKERDAHFARLLERQRILMREEMLAAQAASLKEHAMLSRKLEAVLREKRELSKQLAIAHKENRAAKQQLEELLSEKTCFLKKLETATKQLKSHNKTKKLAFAKLEESQTVIASLKQQLGEVLKEKDRLERKIVCLEEEIERLKGDVEVSDDIPVKSCRSEPEKKDSKEHAVDQRTDDSLDFFIGNEIQAEEKAEEKAEKPSPTISETEIDMQKIQMKIMALERNLEKFSSRKLLPVAPVEPECTTTSRESQESTTVNCEEEEKVDEEEGSEVEEAETEETSNEEKSNVGAVVYKEVFVRNVSKDENLEEKNPPVASKVTARRAEGEKPMATKLPRRIIKTTPNKDASCPSLYKIPEEITLTRKFQFVGQSELKIGSQGKISLRSEGSSALLTSPNSFCSTTTSLVDNDSSSEECSMHRPQRSQNKRMVSSSPAFQKFLKTLDSQER